MRILDVSQYMRTTAGLNFAVSLSLDGPGTRLCAEALAAYRGEFQFQVGSNLATQMQPILAETLCEIDVFSQVHGTSTTSIDGSLPIHHWLETPQVSYEFV